MFWLGLWVKVGQGSVLKLFLVGFMGHASRSCHWTPCLPTYLEVFSDIFKMFFCWVYGFASRSFSSSLYLFWGVSRCLKMFFIGFMGLHVSLQILRVEGVGWCFKLLEVA